MRRRQVDPMSLLFGMLFVAAALIVLLGGSIIDDGHLLLPAGLIGLGVAMFISSRMNGTSRKQAAVSEAAMSEPAVSDAAMSGEYGSGDEVGAEGGEYG